MTSNYTLEIVSHHPQFKNKHLLQYYVDGINTVGAWGDEPFEIRFKNNTYQKVQIKLSLDGTDVLTGKPADTEVSKDMWLVHGYGTLSLKAWPETSNGGAAFLFTSANNSVALNTHGNLSSRGIIAAAVYVEGHRDPVTIQPIYHNHYHNRRITKGVNPYFGFNDSTLDGATYSSNSITSSVNDSDYIVTNSNISEGPTGPTGPTGAVGPAGRTLESLVSVGAGHHVDQKIIYVEGLVKPTFTETIRVKYLWWDDLQTKLREVNAPVPHASGFPGDKNKNVMSIGNTPRLGGSTNRSVQVQPNYSRV
jgi:hypothetical protein